MLKLTRRLALVIILSIAQVNALELPHKYAPDKENAGFGIGAILGGLLGGPPGIVIGAAGGTWLGSHDSKKDNEITSLGKRLQDRDLELGRLQSEFANMQSQFSRDLRKVKLEHTRSTLEQLRHGISLFVYFRTDSFDINPEIQPRIKALADLIRKFPEIHIHLEGHTDRRGTRTHNQALSQRRISAVQRSMIDTGFPKQRIHTHAYGETKAIAIEGDAEGLVFDRYVVIHLTLDTGK